MKLFVYKLNLSSEGGEFEYSVSEQRGTFIYGNIVKINKNLYPLNKILVTNTDLQEICYVSDSEIVGNIESFLVGKYCNEIDETINFLQGMKEKIRGILK